MSIGSKDIKTLWANAAGLCAFPDCQVKLCIPGGNIAGEHTFGEMAHIKGENPGSNRYDEKQDSRERNSYSNLILLCPNHHTLIDRSENEIKFSVIDLHEIKNRHEVHIARRLQGENFSDKYEVAKKVVPLMEANRVSFFSFGPHSEIAQRNPHSDAYKGWLTERLSTIVPNNRMILRVIEENSGLFSIAENANISKFSLHVRSYERWVNEETSYEGVIRFPKEFDEMMRGLANDGT